MVAVSFAVASCAAPPSEPVTEISRGCALIDACALRGQELYDSGRYAEAEPYLLTALEESERKFGPDDPKVATALDNLAELYRAMGRYDQAEPLYERAVVIFDAQLGPDDPNTLATRANLEGLRTEMVEAGTAAPR